MRIIRDKISVEQLKEIAKEDFGSMIKAVIDVERKIMAVGGELHSDEEMMLLDDGSNQKNLWGINIEFDKPRDEWIVFDSLINVRPRSHNRSRGVENPELRNIIIQIVNSLVNE